MLGLLSGKRKELNAIMKKNKETKGCYEIFRKTAAILTAVLLLFIFPKCQTCRSEKEYKISSGVERKTVSEKIIVLLWFFDISQKDFKESEICGSHSLLKVKTADHLGNILSTFGTLGLVFYTEREFICGEKL